MSREEVGVLALLVGLVGGALWSRWRHQVVKELRLIRHILQDAEKAAPREERPSDTEEEEGPPPGP